MFEISNEQDGGHEDTLVRCDLLVHVSARIILDLVYREGFNRQWQQVGQDRKGFYCLAVGSGLNSAMSVGTRSL